MFSRNIHPSLLNPNNFCSSNFMTNIDEMVLLGTSLTISTVCPWNISQIFDDCLQQQRLLQPRSFTTVIMQQRRAFVLTSPQWLQQCSEVTADWYKRTSDAAWSGRWLTPYLWQLNTISANHFFLKILTEINIFGVNIILGHSECIALPVCPFTLVRLYSRGGLGMQSIILFVPVCGCEGDPRLANPVGRDDYKRTHRAFDTWR